MVKLHLELDGDFGEVVRVLHRIGGGDNGNFCSVAAWPLDGGAGCRHHGGSGHRGQSDVGARVEGR